MPDQQGIEIFDIQIVQRTERRSRTDAGRLSDCAGVVDLCDAVGAKRGEQ
jgi:hypothetical protein